MHPEKLISSIPSTSLEDLLQISNIVSEKGGNAYLVGGSVRDLILGKIPHEYDLAVSLLPEIVQKSFPRTVPTGIKHGTITVLIKDRSYELTTFRKDKDYVDGRRPETVHFGVSLSEDLRRRDFTVNAIALDLLKKELIDEHEGQEDIRKKIIRTIGDPIARFTEDGLRPVRGIRFVSSLGFRLEEKTAEAILTCKPITAKVSPERIHDEFLKILKSPNPAPSLELLKEFGILELFTPAKLYPFSSKEWAWDRDAFSGLPSEPDRIRLAFFLHSAFERSHIETETLTFFKNLKFSNQRTKESLFLIKTLYSLLEKEEELRLRSELRRLLLHPIAQFAGKKEIRVWYNELAILWKAIQGKEAFWLPSAEEEWKSDPPLVLADLAINGNILKEKRPNLPPKQLGEVLKTCLNAVLEDPSRNTQESLLLLIP